jgi:hypothetical protein
LCFAQEGTQGKGKELSGIKALLCPDYSIGDKSIGDCPEARMRSATHFGALPGRNHKNSAGVLKKVHNYSRAKHVIFKEALIYSHPVRRLSGRGARPSLIREGLGVGLGFEFSALLQFEALPNPSPTLPLPGEGA